MIFPEFLVRIVKWIEHDEKKSSIQLRKNTNPFQTSAELFKKIFVEKFPISEQTNSIAV